MHSRKIDSESTRNYGVADLCVANICLVFAADFVSLFFLFTLIVFMAEDITDMNFFSSR